MIIIRECRASDEEAILDICYKTGYMGEDLTGLNQFNDKILFGYLFCTYYVRYEREHCFVAVDESKDRVVGYIIGTCDSIKQKKKIMSKMGLRIALRILFVTLWRYPETIVTIFNFLKYIDIEHDIDLLYNEYPAHLHINILSDYQRMGVGEKLLDSFEEHIRHFSKGIHLITSNKNLKAVPFYEKKGYSLIKEKPSKMWIKIEGFKSLVFAKSFE